ncbi:MAG TPA: DHH family phosphoesterase [Candidatus Woesearchaeota archaeon]|nr:DHH family phosphoesterase [Candidatus Woesearchaeota archaeon]
MGEIEFLEQVEKAAEFLRESKPERVRIVSHLDADGITSAAILIRVMNRLNKLYNISVVQSVTPELLDLVNSDCSDFVVFSDLGSGCISKIKEKIKDKRVIVLDHHVPEKENEPNAQGKRVMSINPHFFGIDGNSDISGSGVAYLFANAVSRKNRDLAHIAVIGAIGDMQENFGFSGTNRRILKHALESGKLEERRGIRLFGSHSRPIHKLLEYSTEPYIPGITGSESNAIQLLGRIGINPKKGTNDWKRLFDLSDEEARALASAIIMLRTRSGASNAESIIGPLYEIKDEKPGSPLKDAREFATLLNACGRLGLSSYGIGACLNEAKLKKKSIETLNSYRKEIIKGLKWVKKSAEDKQHIIKGENYMIINAQENIMPTMIGTIASILAKSNEIPENTFILSLAHLPENGKIKCSLRYCGNNDVDLKEVIDYIVAQVEGESGGHKNAAGAFIPLEKEKQFIESAMSALSMFGYEEKITN